MRRFGNKAWFGVAAAFGALLLLAGPAVAGGRVCRQLEAELASLGSGGGSGKVAKYDRAVTAQENHISSARSRARRAGCGFSFLSVGPQICGPLKAHIDKMEGNLDALQRKRSQTGGGGNPKRDRQRILASLDANNCRDKIVAERQPERERNGTFFDRLFGGGLSEGDPLERRPDAGMGRVLGPNDDDYRRRGSPRQPLGSVGVARISTRMAARSDRRPARRVRHDVRAHLRRVFLPDVAAIVGGRFRPRSEELRIRLPRHGASAVLSAKRRRRSETMVSTATGEPYASLSTAYLYRDTAMSRPQGCGCNADPQARVFRSSPARRRRIRRRPSR